MDHCEFNPRIACTLCMESMKAKLKAEELVDKMFTCFQGHTDTYTAKQCAIIACDELIHLAKWASPDLHDYWASVKKEIEKL